MFTQHVQFVKYFKKKYRNLVLNSLLQILENGCHSTCLKLLPSQKFGMVAQYVWGFVFEFLSSLAITLFSMISQYVWAEAPFSVPFVCPLYATVHKILKRDSGAGHLLSNSDQRLRVAFFHPVIMMMAITIMITTSPKQGPSKQPRKLMFCM